MKIVLKKIIACMILINSELSFAGPVDNPPPPPSQVPPIELPIDRDILFGLYIAITLGIYKIRRSKNKEKTPV